MQFTRCWVAEISPTERVDEFPPSHLICPKTNNQKGCKGACQTHNINRYCVIGFAFVSLKMLTAFGCCTMLRVSATDFSDLPEKVRLLPLTRHSLQTTVTPCSIFREYFLRNSSQKSRFLVVGITLRGWPLDRQEYE